MVLFVKTNMDKQLKPIGAPLADYAALVCSKADVRYLVTGQVTWFFAVT